MIDFKGGFKPKILGDVMSMRMGRSVAGTVRKFVPDARVAQMLDHFTQYVGSCPEASPAVLCGIAHMQTQRGRLVPDRRHARGARGAGEARRRTRRRVPHRASACRSVLLKPDGSARRRRTGGRRNGSLRPPSSRTRTACAPTANCSTAAAPKVVEKFDKRRTYEPACSGVVLYLGLNKAYDHLLHHDFVFSPRPARGVRRTSTGRANRPRTRPATSPRTSRTEPGTAPPGGEALYVLVHTPYLRPHHDWKAMLPEYRQVILDKLQDDRDRCRTSRAASSSNGPDAAGHPRPLPRAGRRDLRPREPRQVDRRLQARQPRRPTSRACTSPAARRTRARACRWC